MLDRIGAALHMVAWGNFTDWRVLLAWAAALLGTALVACIVRGAGASVLRGQRFDDDTESLVLHIGTGFGVVAVVLFVLGSVGLYRAAVLAPLALLALAWPALASRHPGALLDGPRELMRVVLRHRWWWLLFAACSLPALLPPHRWDEILTHLPYAEQWVRAGSLTVDPYMRYPLYTFNWTIVQGAALMAGGETLVHMLSWLCGALATLLVGLFLERLGAPRPLRIVAMLAFFVTPVVQRYLVVGMNDVPLMFFLAVSVYALFRLRDPALRTPRQVVAAALCAGMFVGIKVLGILFVPLFPLLAAYRLRGRKLVLYVAVFGAAGVLWYARNLVISGDPAPPLFSELRGVEAPFWTLEDMRLQRLDLERGLSWEPADIARLPLTALTSTESGPMREWPLLGYVLIFPFSLLLVRSLWRDGALDVLVATWWAVGAWVYTTYLGRYVQFLPLLVVCAALVLARLLPALSARWRPAASPGWAWAAGVLLLLGPTLSAPRYLQHTFGQPVPIGDGERWAHVQRRLPEARIVDSVSAHAPEGATVYSVGYSHLKYYFQRRGYRVIGDYFHDGRYGDFRRALEAERAPHFLTSLPAGYLAVDRSYSGELGLAGDSLPERLERLPVLRPLSRDSILLLYEVRRRDLVSH